MPSSVADLFATETREPREPREDEEYAEYAAIRKPQEKEGADAGKVYPAIRQRSQVSRCMVFRVSGNLELHVARVLHESMDLVQHVPPEYLPE